MLNTIFFLSKKSKNMGHLHFKLRSFKTFILSASIFFGILFSGSLLHGQTVNEPTNDIASEYLLASKNKPSKGDKTSTKKNKKDKKEDAEEKKEENIVGLSWFDDDFYRLLIRLGINLVFLTIIIRYLYYSKSKRKDYLFTYYLIGTITFFLCFGLKKLDIDTGMGLGLFAIFGIIRYRTDAIEIKEMTYLFLVIGLSVVNSLASYQISLAEMAVINVFVVILTFLLEFVFLMKHETRKSITYERIDLIVPEKHTELKEDLEQRTGLQINRFEIGRVDFLNDTAQIKVFFYADDQKGS